MIIICARFKNSKILYQFKLTFLKRRPTLFKDNIYLIFTSVLFIVPHQCNHKLPQRNEKSIGSSVFCDLRNKEGKFIYENLTVNCKIYTEHICFVILFSVSLLAQQIRFQI